MNSTAKKQIGTIEQKDLRSFGQMRYDIYFRLKDFFFFFVELILYIFYYYFLSTIPNSTGKKSEYINNTTQSVTFREPESTIMAKSNRSNGQVLFSDTETSTHTNSNNQTGIYYLANLWF